MFACFKVGCGVIPINFRLHPKEFAFIIDHAEAKVAIISPEFNEAIVAIRDDISQVSNIIGVSEAREPFLDYETVLSPESDQF